MNKLLQTIKENDKLFIKEFGIHFKNSSGELQFVKTFLNESRIKELEMLVEIIEDIYRQNEPNYRSVENGEIYGRAICDITQILKDTINKLKTN